MRLIAPKIEEYKHLSDDDLMKTIVQFGLELKRAEVAKANDPELQSAIEYVKGLKAAHDTRILQMKKILKSLHLLAEMRGL